MSKMRRTRETQSFHQYDGEHRLETSIPGALPDRYNEPWVDPLRRLLLPAIQPGDSILDVGSGRRPFLNPHERPEGCEYVGLDVSRQELDLAAPGAYDQRVVSDLRSCEDYLTRRFAAAVAWQVLEHVYPLSSAARNIRSYLKPGGRFVALVSGRWSAYGLANRMTSNAMGQRFMSRFLSRDPETMFPAYYDQCTYTGLEATFRDWSSLSIEPLYRASNYFRFLRTVERAYIRYEDWLMAHNKRNLATHYRVCAVA